MENKEAAAEQDGKDGGKCCTKGKCCGCKALAAVALLAVGALGGYFCARHCGAAGAAAPAVQSQTK